MALFDRNGDGKNDFMDDLIEYEGYKQFISEEDENSHQEHTNTSKSSSSGGISTIGAIIITLLGMFGSGGLCMALEIESGIVIIFLWIVFSALLLIGYCAIKK